MAVLLPKSIYVHLMKTGGWSVRHAIARMKLHKGEIGRGHDPASLLPPAQRNNRFTFVFIRNPLMWYRSYWAYRMQVNWVIVHAKQPITGWQTFGSVLDFECRAYQFETWLRNVLEFVPEGFLSRIYRIYTEGVNYVGRVESLTQDLSQALTLAGESFSPQLLNELPKRNVTNSRFTEIATVPKELAERVMMADLAERRDGDIVFGESAHGEIGVAMEAGVFALALHVDDLANSFLFAGVETGPGVKGDVLTAKCR